MSKLHTPHANVAGNHGREIESANPTANNLFDFTLAQFAPSKEEDLYRAVQAVTADKLESFLDAYSEFAANETTYAPVLKPGELRRTSQTAMCPNGCKDALALQWTITL